MTPDTDALLRSVGGGFGILGDYAGGAPYGSGHINDTFAVTYDQAGVRVRYIFQRINDRVFTDPETLVGNIGRVLDHIGARYARRHLPDRSRRSLTLLRGRHGELVRRDDERRCWRVYLFVEGSRTHDVATSPTQARAAARAFGEFEADLIDLPGPPLAETIPGFHDLGSRFRALEKSVRRDPAGRVAGAMPEIERFAAWFDEVSGSLAKGGAADLPRRVVHNDCKLNNVLVDDRTGEGVCVIDLDTVMEGNVLADFGDMVRSIACTAAEDETDLDRVALDLERFAAVAEGYLEAAGHFLTPAEVGLLRLAGPALTLETGLRFLTDHLEGDSYFRVGREGHNLDRCRTQLRLMESMAEHRRSIEAIVAAASARRAESRQPERG